MDYHDYADGYLQRQAGGRYEGKLRIDQIDISPIEGVYFKEAGKNHLWLKRKPMLEYDENLCKYYPRPAQPQWQAYLTKVKDGHINYKGEFTFLRIKYSIIGIWDDVLGKEKHRLNFYVERLPMAKQTIINKIKNLNNETSRSN